MTLVGVGLAAAFSYDLPMGKKSRTKAEKRAAQRRRAAEATKRSPETSTAASNEEPPDPEPAPNTPGGALAHAIAEMKDQLLEAKKQVAVAIGDEKRLKMQRDEQAKQAAEWERRAQLAVHEGNEALAREALHRQNECEELGTRLESTWQIQKEGVDKLKEQLRALYVEVEARKHEYYPLVAQEHIDEARETIRSTLRRLQDTPLFNDFEGLVGPAKLARLRREIEAAREDLGVAIARGERLAAKLDALLKDPTGSGGGFATA